MGAQMRLMVSFSHLKDIEKSPQIRPKSGLLANRRGHLALGSRAEVSLTSFGVGDDCAIVSRRGFKRALATLKIEQRMLDAVAHIAVRAVVNTCLADSGSDADARDAAGPSSRANASRPGDVLGARPSHA